MLIRPTSSASLTLRSNDAAPAVKAGDVADVVALPVAAVRVVRVVVACVEDEAAELVVVDAFVVVFTKSALAAKTPPSTVGGVTETLVLEARIRKASKVLPVAGALMAPTMPDWQWLFAVWLQ